MIFPWLFPDMYELWSTIYYPMLCLKIAGWVANIVAPDEMLQCGVLSGSTLFAQACLAKYVGKV